MNTPKKELTFSLLLLVIISLACNYLKPKEAETVSNSNAGNSNNDTAENKKPKRDPNEKTFRGNIFGESPSPFVMTLKRDGNSLTGTYYYVKSRKDIALKGAIDKAGKFKLEESSEGKVTGTFTGDWLDSEDEPLTRLEGQWKKPGGDELGFGAVEQSLDTSGNQTIEDKSTKEEDKKKKLFYEIIYPKISGFGTHTDAINKELAAAFDTDIASFKKDVEELCGEVETNCSFEAGYDTTLATDDLLSFHFEASVYTGGAHPNSYSKNLTFDVKTGKKIKLAELFKPNSNYLKKISDISVESLRKQLKKIGEGQDPDEEMLRSGTEPSNENYSEWNITKKGLLINFDPYQVAAYAYGPQRVLIPFNSLKDIAKEDGALSPFIK